MPNRLGETSEHSLCSDKSKNQGIGMASSNSDNHTTTKSNLRKSILDPTFKYVKSSHSDISKTFARERKRLAEEKAKLEVEQAQVVRQIKGKR